MRPLVWWCAANFSADWLLNFAQVFGLPLRWATYDPAAPQETVDGLCEMLQKMGSAGWGAFPNGTALEVKAEGQRSGGRRRRGICWTGRTSSVTCWCRATTDVAPRR